MKLTLQTLTNKWKYFSFEGPHIRERSLLSGRSPVRPSGKDNMYMKKSLDHWWNNIDERKLKHPEKNLSQCHFTHQNLTRNDLESIPGLRGESSGRKYKGHRPWSNIKICYKIGWDVVAWLVWFRMWISVWLLQTQ